MIYKKIYTALHVDSNCISVYDCVSPLVHTCPGNTHVKEKADDNPPDLKPDAHITNHTRCATPRMSRLYPVITRKGLA